MAPPFDWFRASLPFTRFHAHFYRARRSWLRALVDCFVLVCALEAMRLLYFYKAPSVHKFFTSELNSESMVADSFAAWPEGLVFTLSPPDGLGAPARLSVNRPVPIEVGLPPWFSASMNAALSFTMHSAAVLHFVPPKPIVLITSESELNAGRGKLGKLSVSDADRTVVALTESAVYLVSADDAGERLIAADCH